MKRVRSLVLGYEKIGLFGSDVENMIRSSPYHSIKLLLVSLVEASKRYTKKARLAPSLWFDQRET